MTPFMPSSIFRPFFTSLPPPTRRLRSASARITCLPEKTGRWSQGWNHSKKKQLRTLRWGFEVTNLPIARDPAPSEPSSFDPLPLRATNLPAGEALHAPRPLAGHGRPHEIHVLPQLGLLPHLMGLFEARGAVVWGSNAPRESAAERTLIVGVCALLSKSLSKSPATAPLSPWGRTVAQFPSR